ncbi:hypothetical protein FZEAL_9760 [Fusarium zealandicum]|uniref:Uncharacterized protein n=1 Tax=Fusarium zealandicum TaxID=1053134 RepID=A0A8H4U8G9_9HYPO|nr:hypothetical protein FZEAL_9760 [Fusarium zealandicum]
MPRFGVAFNRRKSAATPEDLQHGSVTPEQSSFRVIERNDPSLGKSFDGGARMARATGNHVRRPSQLDLDGEDNMFADLKSGNRHSNASTAPSSTNLEGHDDSKHSHKKNLHDIGARAAPKSSGSGFLNRAGRTFSFGVQKKNSASPPKHDAISDVPPVPTIQHDDFSGRARGMTESTTSTATPPKLENGGLDMGGDFGSMFSTFDKRASVATVRNDGSSAPRSLTGNRSIQPAPLSINKATKVEPGPVSWNSRYSDDNLLGSAPASPEDDLPPPVPRHNSSFKTTSRPSDIIEDEDARLLQDSIAVGQLLSDSSTPNPPSGRYRRDEDSFASFERKPLNTSFNKGDDNMFEGTLAHSSRIAHRYASRAPSPPRNKVMTPAQFERYRKDKERHDAGEAAQPAATDDDDDDEINYDDDEDDIEKSRQQARQRRKQEAHMAVYRQQMMKVTGEQPDMQTHDRPGLASSMSAPQLHLMKPSTSPDPPTGISDEDEDDEVPLAILQAHGFPAKNRPPARLSTMGSNPNLRASAQLQPRAGSAMGDASGNPNQRHSTLPAFARGLPQDPFVGAGLSKPAVRESLMFSGGIPASESQQSLPPGGLVGVIASEERSKAMRRNGANPNGQKLVPGLNGPQGQSFDNMPPAMMNNMGAMNGMYNMPGMGMPQMLQPPQLTAGDQAQIQMTQQMSQFMQMQMQFMQMMAGNPQQQANGGMPQMPQMSQMQQPYGGLPAAQSMNDVSSRHSMMYDPGLEPPRRMDAGMRTMSMVQPSSASFMQPGGYAGSVHGGPAMGYTPSIAPSERSNIGLPGRYRPVSQAVNPMIPDNHRRTNTMSGALGRWDESKGKSTINVVSAAGGGSDDDDEEGWEAMKAKREKKRTQWKSKKGYGSELSTMM